METTIKRVTEYLTEGAIKGVLVREDVRNLVNDARAIAEKNADLLAKVSEQEKEIAERKEGNHNLIELIALHKKANDDLRLQVSEQQREIEDLKEEVADLKIKCSTDPELLKAENRLALAMDVRVSEQSQRIQEQAEEIYKLRGVARNHYGTGEIARERVKQLEEALREALGYVKHFPGDIVEQELIEKIEALLSPKIKKSYGQ